MHSQPLLYNTQLSYSTVVLYINDHGDLGFSDQTKINQKPALQYHPDTLAAEEVGHDVTKIA